LLESDKKNSVFEVFKVTIGLEVSIRVRVSISILVRVSIRVSIRLSATAGEAGAVFSHTSIIH